MQRALISRSPVFRKLRGADGVHVTEKEKLTDTVSGPTPRLIFQEFPLAKFWCRVKEECP